MSTIRMQKKTFVNNLIDKIKEDKSSPLTHTGEHKPGHFTIGERNLNSQEFELKTTTRASAEKFQEYLEKLDLKARIVPPNVLDVWVKYPEFKESNIANSNSNGGNNNNSNIQLNEGEKALLTKYKELFPLIMDTVEQKRELKSVITKLLSEELSIHVPAGSPRGGEPRKGDYSMSKITENSKTFELHFYNKIAKDLYLENVYNMLSLFGDFKLVDTESKIVFFFEKDEDGNTGGDQKVVRKYNRRNQPIDCEAFKSFQKHLNPEELNGFNYFLKSISDKIETAEKRGALENQKSLLPKINGMMTLKNFYEFLESNGLKVLRGYDVISFKELQKLMKSE